MVIDFAVFGTLIIVAVTAVLVFEALGDIRGKVDRLHADMERRRSKLDRS